MFRQFDTTYLYTANFITVTAALSAASTVITFVVTLTDAYSGVGPDSVNGTLTHTTALRQPSTTYISNTWGTPTMNAASWSLS
jgi:hypothetical protein